MPCFEQELNSCSIDPMDSQRRRCPSDNNRSMCQISQQGLLMSFGRLHYRHAGTYCRRRLGLRLQSQLHSIRTEYYRKRQGSSITTTCHYNLTTIVTRFAHDRYETLRYFSTPHQRLHTACDSRSNLEDWSVDVTRHHEPATVRVSHRINDTSRDRVSGKCLPSNL